MWCHGVNPERRYDGPPLPPTPVSNSETKLGIADGIAVTEKESFLFAAGDALQGSAV